MPALKTMISTLPEELAKNLDPMIMETLNLAAAKVGELYGLENAELSVTLTNDATIKDLNAKYRGLDQATDVLSFALNESDEPAFIGGEGVDVLGDIVISLERAKAQSKEYGHSFRREIAFLVVHGLLHLLGYDHIEEADRLEMEEEQRQVMAALGISR